MKKISIMTPCYNEEDNIQTVIDSVKEIFKHLENYTYEHIFIDNASTDQTAHILRAAASNDKHIKVIFNAGNYGHIRSPYYGLLQATGDAIIPFVADLQDPPEIIPKLIAKWESGTEIVMAIKNKSRESPLMFSIRRLYYGLVKMVSEEDLISNFTGFGLYDRKVIEALKQFKDPYPYFRGIIAQIGFKKEIIEYTQPKRNAGKTKNNFYTLFDMAMLGFVNNTKLPLRIATLLGFICSGLSLLVAVIYFIYKLAYWDTFSAGTAPLVIGLFFLGSVQMMFIGILGEYIGAIYTQTKDKPLVIERERINFD
ncbi:MAG: glycosyltransferase family 2 protein [Deltaproteobacteria bacterium]|nr:glycosyltransferase family 2 protein [Deltaproteobacteria bacterium]